MTEASDSPPASVITVSPGSQSADHKKVIHSSMQYNSELASGRIVQIECADMRKGGPQN